SEKNLIGTLGAAVPHLTPAQETTGSADSVIHKPLLSSEPTHTPILRPSNPNHSEPEKSRGTFEPPLPSSGCDDLPEKEVINTLNVRLRPSKPNGAEEEKSTSTLPRPDSSEANRGGDSEIAASSEKRERTQMDSNDLLAPLSVRKNDDR